MYLHIGNNKMIRTDAVVGIFDLDNTTISKRTRNYLNRAEKGGYVETVGYELPKSFVVCAEKKGENRVFLSPLATTTLFKRTGKIDF